MSVKHFYWLILALCILTVVIFVATVYSVNENSQGLINTIFPTENLNLSNVESNSGYPVDFCTLDYVVCVGEENEVKLVKWYAKSSAYTSYETCPDGNCIMANGEKAYWGAVACPREIELGTEILIDGMEFTCADYTAKKFDGRFDIFYGYTKEAHEKALQYGIKNSEIIIL